MNTKNYSFNTVDNQICKIQDLEFIFQNKLSKNNLITIILTTLTLPLSKTLSSITTKRLKTIQTKIVILLLLLIKNHSTNSTENSRIVIKLTQKTKLKALDVVIKINKINKKTLKLLIKTKFKVFPRHFLIDLMFQIVNTSKKLLQNHNQVFAKVELYPLN